MSFRRLFIPGVLIAALVAVMLSGACAKVPVAAMSASVTEGQAPLRVTFTNLSENADSFTWDFGDGATMTTRDVSEFAFHDFKLAWEHTVTLTAAKGSQTSVATVTITVEPGPLFAVRLDEREVHVEAGGHYRFQPKAVDSVQNEVSNTRFAYSATEAAGVIDGAGSFTATTRAGRYESGVVVEAEQDGRTVSEAVTVVVNAGAPVSLSLEPGEAVVAVGEIVQFSVSGVDEFGNPVPETDLSFEARREAGTIDGQGRFRAGTKVGRYENAVSVRVGEAATSRSATVVVAPGPLDRVVIHPTNPSVIAGESQLFAAEMFDRFGNLIPASSVAISFVADPELGVIDERGVLTVGTKEGTPQDGVTVRAEQGNITRRANTRVRIVGGVLHHLTIDSATTTPAGASELRIVATARDEYGNAIEDLPLVYELAPGAGTISSTGLVTAQTKAGVYKNALKITATQGPVTRSVAGDLVIKGAAVERLIIPSYPPTAPAGEPVWLDITPVDRYGNPIFEGSFRYSTIAFGIGEVAPDGRFLAYNRLGEHQNAVTVRFTMNTSMGEVTAATSTALRIVPGPVATMQVEPSQALVNIDSGFSISVTGFDSYGNPTPDAEFTFEADPRAGVVDEAGNFTAGTTAGTFPQGVVVSAKGPGGATTKFSVLTRIQPGPVLAAVVTPSSAVVEVGKTITFTVKAVDVFGNEIPASEAIWQAGTSLGTITSGGVLTVGDTPGFFPQGVAAIVAAGGTSVQASASVTVVAGIASTIQVNTGAAVQATGSRQLAATVRDSLGNALTGYTVAWRMLDPRVGTVSSTGLLTAGEIAGTYPAAVEASVMLGDLKVAGTGTVVIGPSVLDRVLIGPGNPEIGRGAAQQFSAIGVDRFGNRINDLGFFWSVSGGAGAIDSSGLFTAGNSAASFSNAIRAETTHGFVSASATASVTVVPDRFAFHSNRVDDVYAVYVQTVPLSQPRAISQAGARNGKWSPDGRLVLYDTDTQLFIAGEDGRWRAPVSIAGLTARQGAWAPSQARIAFSGTGTGAPEIYTIALDGSGVTRLTNNTTTDEFPTWNPAGTEIAFMSGVAGNPEIYKIGSTGASLSRLTNSPGLSGRGEDTAPAWGPGGSILFQSGRSAIVRSVYLMSSTGTGVLSLLSTSGPDEARCPAWTTDGLRFLYDVGTAFAAADIVIRDIAGGNLTSLVSDPSDDRCPHWSPVKQGVHITGLGVIVAGATPGVTLPQEHITATARAATVRLETSGRQGTGFVISPGNLILTTNRFVLNATAVTVRTWDGKTHTATVVGRDMARDVALLSLGSTVTLPALALGEMGRLRSGDTLTATGYGAATTTSAMVTYTAPDEDAARNVLWLRTDGIFTTDFDGGPVLSPRGDVVGMVSLRFVSTEAGGSGLAIGVNTLANYLDRLKAGQVIVK